jgi:hypothetical protein
MNQITIINETRTRQYKTRLGKRESEVIKVRALWVVDAKPWIPYTAAHKIVPAN